MSLRCFIAIELPRTLKEEIEARTDKVRKCGADARWVRADNLHLTLKFLGSVPEESIQKIEDALAEAAGRHACFRLNFRGAGVFPNRKRPRVVWIDVEDSDRVVLLQKDIEEAMASLGYDSENRPYSPHLTIGRLKSTRRRDLLLRELDVLSGGDFGAVEVTEVSLMQSTLKPSGAEYSKLFGAALSTS